MKFLPLTSTIIGAIVPQARAPKSLRRLHTEDQVSPTVVRPLLSASDCVAVTPPFSVNCQLVAIPS